MNNFRHSSLIAVLSLAAVATLACQLRTSVTAAEPDETTVKIKGTQEGPEVRQPAKTPAAQPPLARQPRDPFANTKAIQDQAAKNAATPEARYTPGTDNARAIPGLRLKGYIEDRYQAPVALVEIEGYGVFLVREGDAISLQTRSGNALLKVQRVTNVSVQVEVGSLGQVMVVR